MRCPFCQHAETRVIDSRLNAATNQIRRRRECLHCNQRFNTLENIELELPYIVKRDGRRVAFNEQKLRTGLLRALEKRPITIAQIDIVLQQLVQRLHNQSEREIASSLLGEWVMEALQKIDLVAYMRFKSVYQNFKDIDAFRTEIERLEQREDIQHG